MMINERIKNALIFFFTVLIWSTTWYALKLQVSDIPFALSVSFRFFIAVIFLYVWKYIKPIPCPKPLSRKALIFLCLQGFFLFSYNYILYEGTVTNLKSGLSAILFSLVIIPNILFESFLLKRRVHACVLLGVLSGLIGIVFVFWQDLQHCRHPHIILYICLALCGSLFASVGNILSAFLQRDGYTVRQTMIYAMAFGCLFSFLGAVTQHDITLISVPSISYIGATLYLGILGSTVAFSSYLTLIGRIGPTRAAYVLIITPIFALIISHFLESFKWDTYSLLGTILTLGGNILILRGKQK